MRTWKIENGDVAIDNIGRIETLTGTKKIIQDLTGWLINDLGYNRFHPWMGGDLDQYVGQAPTARLLQIIRQRIRDSLNLYYQTQIDDLRQRIEERGDPLLAIGLADPTSIVKEWKGLYVTEEAGHIHCVVLFSTFTEVEDQVSLVIGVGNIS